MGFFSLPGQQQDKDETVTALFPFPHHVRETTSSWETPMPQGTFSPAPVCFHSGKFLPPSHDHRHHSWGPAAGDLRTTGWFEMKGILMII